MKRFGLARGFSRVKRFPNFWPAGTKRFQLGGLSTTTKNEALQLDGGINNSSSPNPRERFDLGKRFGFRLGSFAPLLKRKRFRSG